MIANTTEYQNPRANERHNLTPMPCGGFRVTVTGQFPQTDLDILMPPCGPLKIRTLLDCDRDGVRDHEAVSVLRFHDDNNNGRVDRGEDSLSIRTDEVKALPGVPFDFDGADRVDAAKLVVAKLGGNPGDVVEDPERWDGMS